MQIQSRAGGDVVQLSLRMPVGLRDMVKEKADAEGRSLNTLVVRMLSKSTGYDPETEAGA